MVYILFSFPIAISFKMAGTYLVPYRISSWAQATLLWCGAALTSLTLGVIPKPSSRATRERAGLINIKIAAYLPFISLCYYISHVLLFLLK